MLAMIGSLAIDSITEEFVRQQSDIAELQAYLQLPQHKPLKAQLDEAGELMDGAKMFYFPFTFFIFLLVLFYWDDALLLRIQFLCSSLLCSAESPYRRAGRRFGPRWHEDRGGGGQQPPAG